jgi:hypothetical protein
MLQSQEALRPRPPRSGGCKGEGGGAEESPNSVEDSNAIRNSSGVKFISQGIYNPPHLINHIKYINPMILLDNAF